MKNLLPQVYSISHIGKINNTYHSLLEAMREAGGCTDEFVWDNLKEINVADLLILLGINNIKFEYKKEKNDER